MNTRTEEGLNFNAILIQLVKKKNEMNKLILNIKNKIE